VSTPATVQLPMPATAIGGGFRHTCAVLADGSLRCWGANGSGELGDGTRAIALPGNAVVSSATAISTGSEHACALTAGRVQYWGMNALTFLSHELVGRDQRGRLLGRQRDRIEISSAARETRAVEDDLVEAVAARDAHALPAL
jgi:hypothetical protein